MNQNMNVDKSSVVVAEFITRGWTVLRFGGTGGCLLQIKKHKEEVEIGEERRVKRQVIN